MFVYQAKSKPLPGDSRWGLNFDSSAYNDLGWVSWLEQAGGKKVESIVLTVEILEKGLSRNGEYSSKQLRLLGVEGFPKGWKKDSIGRSFPHGWIDK